MNLPGVVLIVISATMFSVYCGPLVFGSTIQIPILGPDNQTYTLNYPDSAKTVQFPFNNTAVTIDIEEYKKCVASSNQTIINTMKEMGLNTPEYADSIKGLQIVGMESCIVDK